MKDFGEGNRVRTYSWIWNLIFASVLLLTAGAAHADDDCAECPMATFTGTYRSLDTLTIAPPEGFLYALIDGYSFVDGVDTTQKFTQIKAKVKSAIPNVSLGAGEVWAIARYHINNIYAPDLSTGAPQEAYVAEETSFSTSAMIPVTSLSDQSFTEFAFDFSTSPIPAGIVELELKVFFRGEMAGSDYDVFLWGTKDLNEPMHLSIINSTDIFYLKGVYPDRTLFTEEEILSDQNLKNAVDLDKDGVINEFWQPYPDNEPIIYPVTMSVALNFGAEMPTTWKWYYCDLAPGTYGRMILLTEGESFYTLYHWQAYENVNDFFEEASLDYLYPGVADHWVNLPGSNDRVFEYTVVYTIRDAFLHQAIIRMGAYPDIDEIFEAYYYDLSPEERHLTLRPMTP
jgi:hypothetical protein